ncbi:MAG TPA: hypothetical protein VER76_01755 [Pyrinomonadaceae bacterium]|nr:hypothetical protein [Pyrinomonadaceae bacterium]
MKQTENIFIGSLARVSVIFASLVSLCISDGIGPRLIPFPSSSLQESLKRFDVIEDKIAFAGSTLFIVSIEPNAHDDNGVKVLTPVWNSSALGQTALCSPSDESLPLSNFYTSPSYSYFFTSSPPGRAPPQNT